MKHPLRLIQSLTLLLTGLYALFVLLGNLMDYQSNYAFVEHVLSMDTTFEGNALMWRAITEPWVWTLAYIGIIVAEALVAALGIVGGITLFARRNADADRYNHARTWGFATYGLALLIWFFGFIVIGSEWFAMWQSSTWNGKDTAMPLAILFAVFAVLLAINEPQREARRE